MLKATILVLLIAVYSGACSFSLQDEAGKFGGGETKIQKHPYHCSIELDGKYLCSGVVLNKKYILTLADCFYGRTTATAHYLVRTGSDTFNEGGDLHNVTAITTHPQYNQKYNRYNLALLKVKSGLKLSKKVKKINLAKNELRNGQKAILTAWIEKKHKWILQKATLKAVGFKACASVYSKNGYNITHSVLCAVETKNAPVMMGTEFGAPLVSKGKLYGVFSNCYQFSDKSVLPCLFSSVHAASRWIIKTISK